MIGQHVAAKATADTLFLSFFDVTNLPKVVIAAALLSIFSVIGASKALARYGPSLLIPCAFGASAVLFVVEWMLYPSATKAIAVVIYLHVASFSAILISGFWSVVNERFDPHTAKFVIARTAAAAALGGVLGGLMAERVTSLMDLRTMLLMLAAAHVLCAGGIIGMSGLRRLGSQRAEPRVSSGLAIIRRHKYLQQMTLLMVLVAAIATLVDYAFKAQASVIFVSTESLMAFFASFYAVAAVVGFAVQAVLGPRTLQRFGIGPTMAVLPVAIILIGLMGLAVTQLWAVVLLRGAQTVFQHSLFRAAFELLYTPLPLRHKRPTKAIVDVSAARLGDMLSGGAILALLVIIPRLPVPLVVGLAAALSAVALYAVRRLHRVYVEQLAQNLRSGVVSLDRDQALDATTQQILAETSVYTEREQLMARIKEMRAARRATTSEGASSSPVENEASPPARGIDGWNDDTQSLEATALGPFSSPSAHRDESERLVRAVTRLTSGDSDLIRQVSRGDFMDVRLVPFLIPLLAHPEVAEDARMELRWLAPRVIGQLTDALQDPDVPLLARQRIPGVLDVCHNPRAVEGLLQGLADATFNVRYSCARALARMRSRSSALKIPRSAVYAVVKLEVSVDREEWESRTLAVDGPIAVNMPTDINATEKAERSVEHVFTLLGLVHDAGVLRLAQQALYSGDRHLRGTALEYLENVLPEDIQRGLWPHLHVAPRAPRTRRPRREIIRDLRKAAYVMVTKKRVPR